MNCQNNSLLLLSLWFRVDDLKSDQYSCSFHKERDCNIFREVDAVELYTLHTTDPGHPHKSWRCVS